ncbi:MAG: hypothetical protein AAGF73_14545 [Actinomycetota bacterium]
MAGTSLLTRALARQRWSHSGEWAEPANARGRLFSVEKHPSGVVGGLE